MQPPPISRASSTAIVTDFSVIIVCWNNKDYLEPCLESLYNGNLKSSFDIVVVDNGSTDGSQEMLRQKYPDIKIIQNDHNVGLSKASNQGIMATSGRYVLLFNNDTLVNGPSLDALVDFLDQTADAGAVGGRLLNPDGSFQAAGSNFPSLQEEFLISTRLGALFWPSYPDIRPSDQIQVVDWIGSACLLVRREVFNRVGLLDEEYFIYGDEADLQYRIKRAGWKVYYLPNVTTIHYGGRSMDRWRRRKMVYRGKMLFFKKNYGALQSAVLRIMLGLLSLVKLAIWRMAVFFPSSKERASKELNSNLEVIQLCWQLK
jgi:GT2 family glycosyltransferase